MRGSSARTTSSTNSVDKLLRPLRTVEDVRGVSMWENRSHEEGTYSTDDDSHRRCVCGFGSRNRLVVDESHAQCPGRVRNKCTDNTRRAARQCTDRCKRFAGQYASQTRCLKTTRTSFSSASPCIYPLPKIPENPPLRALAQACWRRGFSSWSAKQPEAWAGLGN
jgi:hypothetical protein